MQKFFRLRPKHTPGRGRQPARWTIWEVLLLSLSVLLIIFPLYAETYRWINPLPAPAQEIDPTPPSESAPVEQPAPDEPVEQPAPDAPVEQPAPDAPAVEASPEPAPAPENTPESVVAPTELPADLRRPATFTPEPPPGETVVAPTDVGPTNTTEPVGPTNTTEPVGPTNTTEPVGPTSTTDPNVPPTSTSDAGTPVPTNTFVPTRTSIPSGPITLFKQASDEAVNPGQQFSYFVSVFTTSTSDIQVSLSDVIDSRLQVLSASSGCSAGQTVTCALTVRNGSPASVTIQVRVQPNTQPGTITNQASASGGGSSSVSDVVSVTVLEGVSVPTATTGSGTPIPPTAVPTTPPVPGDPTTPPGPGDPTPPPASGDPTNTLPPVQPTTPPSDGGGDNDNNNNNNDGDRDGDDNNGGGGGGDNDVTPIAPPAPPESFSGPLPPPPTPTQPGPASGVPNVPAPPVQQPVAPPVQQPVAPPQQQQPPLVQQPVQPQAPVATQVPVEGGEQAPVAAEETSTPQPAPTSTGVFFRMASDWGSTFAGNEVQYTIVLWNTRPPSNDGANDLTDVVISSNLPSNVEVLGSQADRGNDPTVNGNSVQYVLDRLQPGEAIEITIAARINNLVDAGTLIVAQAQLQYAGVLQPLYSNIVTVLVVEEVSQVSSPTLSPTSGVSGSPRAVGTATAVVTSTVAAYPPPSPVATLTEVATDTPTAIDPTEVPLVDQTVTPTVAVAGGEAQTEAPLPATSAGVPMLGFVILGLTLFIRQVRLHRERERI